VGTSEERRGGEAAGRGERKEGTSGDGGPAHPARVSTWPLGPWKKVAWPLSLGLNHHQCSIMSFHRFIKDLQSAQKKSEIYKIFKIFLKNKIFKIVQLMIIYN
jgi:hypothetical protein